MAKTRTNIAIDGDDVRVIMERYGLTTMTEAVGLALRHLAGQPMTREQALKLRGAQLTRDIPTDSAPRSIERS